MNTAILVLAEHLKGELADITYEMLGVGRRLADASQSPLYAALLGHGVAPLAERLGLADQVLMVDHPPAGGAGRGWARHANPGQPRVGG